MHRTTTVRSTTVTVTVALMLLALLAVKPAQALLTIEVTKGVDAAIPIAVVPFGVSGDAIQPADIIEADLARSGKFDTLKRDAFIDRPQDLASVNYKIWRLLKIEALVIGRVNQLSNGQYEIRFRLLDVFRGEQLIGRKFIVPAKKLRKAAHQISDYIYEALTGKRGAFDTRIAYVTVDRDQPPQRFFLQVADADGHNPRTILNSPQPILSPSWSPDGNRIAYVSFEKKRSMIYVQDLWSGERTRIAEHTGINSAPAWSPDGTKLAMTLSRDGNPEIYIHDIASGNARRLTRHPAIDTEPTWSPDGGTIAFTSSRAGPPQIYSIAANGSGRAQRLTFGGRYNAGASYSSDGKFMVLITNQGNGYRVGLYSAEHRTVKELTRTSQDESPTFAPNDEMIIYATQADGQNVLAGVSTDGKVQQFLRLQDGIIREPAWSPFDSKL